MGKFTKPSNLRDSNEILKVTNLSKSYKIKSFKRNKFKCKLWRNSCTNWTNGSGKSL